MGFSGSSVVKKIACQCRSCLFNPWVGKSPWSRKWQPTPVFLPGKFPGQGSLAGYHSWGCKESDMTEHEWSVVILLSYLVVKCSLCSKR